MAVPTSTTTKQKINGKNNKAEAVIKIKVMLRGLCSASSIFPVVYLIKATTTTRKMEAPELKLFRMTLFYLTAMLFIKQVIPEGLYRGSSSYYVK